MIEVFSTIPTRDKLLLFLLIEGEAINLSKLKAFPHWNSVCLSVVLLDSYKSSSRKQGRELGEARNYWIDVVEWIDSYTFDWS